MAKIKLTDLPQDEKISKEEMKKVFGGIIIIDGHTGGLESIQWEAPQSDLNQTTSIDWVGSTRAVVDGAGEAD